MTGVVKSVGKYALLAGTALALSISVASAASLTKAGMDKRVADLEREVTLLKNQMKSAMMAKPADKMVQSGNSRVKVTLSGQVNRAVRFASTGAQSALQSVDNGESNSRLGVTAMAQINPNLSAAAWLEMGFAGVGRGISYDKTADDEGTFALRHSTIALTHKDMGTLSIGHSGLAGSGGVASGFSGTGLVFTPLGPGSNDGVTATATVLGKQRKGKARGSAATGGLYGRQNRISYSTPNLMGASIGAAYHENKGWSAGFGYSGGVKEIGVALGAGYQYAPAGKKGANAVLAVSGGLKHNSSGLSVNGYYGNSNTAKLGMAPASKSSYWMADVSWTGKVNDMGATNLSVGYGVWGDVHDASTTRYHIALLQKVDAAAADIYVGLSYDTGDFTHTVAHADTRQFQLNGVTGKIGYAADSAKTYASDNSEDQLDQACGVVANGTDAAETDGDTCSISRDGVFVFLAGIRIKF